MQFTSVLSAGFLVLSTASAGHATTTEIFDSTHETFTLSTTVTSEFNVPCCEESASFNGSFTIQFFGLNGIYDPTKYPLFLTIPVIQTVGSDYPQLAGGMVCLDTTLCLDGPYNSKPTQTWPVGAWVPNLNTTPVSVPFILTTEAGAESHQPLGAPWAWVNTTGTGTEVIDFGALTLTDPFGNNLLSEGVTFQVTAPAGVPVAAIPEPSSWALGVAGLALIAFRVRKRSAKA